MLAYFSVTAISIFWIFDEDVFMFGAPKEADFQNETDEAKVLREQQ